MLQKIWGYKKERYSINELLIYFATLQVTSILENITDMPHRSKTVKPGKLPIEHVAIHRKNDI